MVADRTLANHGRQTYPANAAIVENELLTRDEPLLFLAGHVAPAGTYQMSGTDRVVRLEVAGVLPASLDGQVAVYHRRAETWAELMSHRDANAV